MLRQGTDPQIPLVRVPAAPVGFEHADGVAQVERQANPPGAHVRAAHHLGDMLNGGPILPLKVDEEYVHRQAAPLGRHLQREMQQHGGVLAPGERDTNPLELVKDKVEAIDRRLVHGIGEVALAHNDSTSFFSRSFRFFTRSTSRLNSSTTSPLASKARMIRSSMLWRQIRSMYTTLCCWPIR